MKPNPKLTAQQLFDHYRIASRAVGKTPGEVAAASNSFTQVLRDRLHGILCKDMSGTYEIFDTSKRLWSRSKSVEETDELILKDGLRIFAPRFVVGTRAPGEILRIPPAPFDSNSFAAAQRCAIARDLPRSEDSPLDANCRGLILFPPSADGSSLATLMDVATGGVRPAQSRDRIFRHAKHPYQSFWPNPAGEAAWSAFKRCYMVNHVLFDPDIGTTAVHEDRRSQRPGPHLRSALLLIGCPV